MVTTSAHSGPPNPRNAGWRLVRHALLPAAAAMALLAWQADDVAAADPSGLLGTATEMAGGTMEAAQPAIKPAVDAAAAVTADALGPTSPTAAVREAVEAVTSAVQPAMQPLAEGVTEPLAQPVLEAIASAPVGDALTTVAAVHEGLAPVIDPMTETLAPITTVVIDRASPVLGPVRDVVEPVTPPAVDELLGPEPALDRDAPVVVAPREASATARIPAIAAADNGADARTSQHAEATVLFATTPVVRAAHPAAALVESVRHRMSTAASERHERTALASSSPLLGSAGQRTDPAIATALGMAAGAALLLTFAAAGSRRAGLVPALFVPPG